MGNAWINPLLNKRGEFYLVIERPAVYQFQHEMYNVFVISLPVCLLGSTTPIRICSLPFIYLNVKKAKSDVYLSILGFGQENYKDAEMEELTNKGNGNYAYIDTLNEAKKVLVEQAAGTLTTTG